MKDWSKGLSSESRRSDINVILDGGFLQPQPLKECSGISFPGTSPRTLFSPSTSRRATFASSFCFCQMAALEQPVDLGARSDTLEQVRCSQRGRVNCFTHAILRVIDIQKG